ncbi:MAG TPA: DNA translocase FtsK [Candidatus Rubrimentiphilum sp.]|nr:DNA translocase FtsK [Candidatus Rubrimentiphilum sp.]
MQSMARVRRRAAKSRLNYEIAGMAAIGIAVLLAVALTLAPAHAGYIGAATARALHWTFGAAAGLFPVLIALFGAIIFLEINLTRIMATFGVAALGYFILIDASLAKRGGFLGTELWRGLSALLGLTGSRIVIGLIAVLLLVWISDVSVKKIIGWLVLVFSKLRMPKVRLALPEGHETLRDAFALPATQPKKERTDLASTAIIPVEPVAAPLPVAVDYEDEEVLEDDAADDEEEEEADDDPDIGEEEDDEELDDETDDDDLDEDEDEDEDEDADEPAVSGEYESAAAVAGGPRAYKLPDLSLFDPPQAQAVDDSTRSHVLEDTLASFGVGAKVVHIERGPSVTRYELKPDRGVKISKIANLADDLALALAATSVRIEAPIPGKSAVGIEVPNKTVSIVSIREILEALPQRGQVPPLWMALGKDVPGRAVLGDLSRMPHMLIAGATGSGKSVCLNSVIASLLVSATPDQVQILMIDPKRVELVMYNGIPHLIKEVITDPRLAAGALFEMTKEMEARYERFAKAGVRKIEEYNAKYPDENLPYVVIVIDELADLMLIAPARVETTIMRLAQLARATGIHLIVATQRPSVDVITGLIKANIPSRIAFAVTSQVDSRTILDLVGAERLLGRGDMLYLPIDSPKPIRAQGAFISGGELQRLIHFWTKQARPQNLLDVDIQPISDEEKKDVDPLCFEAAKFIIESNYASTAALQSQFSIGHPRAVRIMKQLEELKVVGPHEGTKPRRIHFGLDDLERISDRFGTERGQQDLFAAGS